MRASFQLNHHTQNDLVIPAQAGIQTTTVVEEAIELSGTVFHIRDSAIAFWIPACAGMTESLEITQVAA